MIAVARSINHGFAYSEYAANKDKSVFVGADNMITNSDLIFNDNDLIRGLWKEFEEAGVDYVRKGKEVSRNVIAIEFSPSKTESENWTREQWFDKAKELLNNMDKVRLQEPIWSAKNKRYKRDNNGKLKMRDIPLTQLAKSKWMAYLHKDSESGIWHLHIIISRFNPDNELNCDDEIAKKAAQAAEELNRKYGYPLAEDIHNEHVEEIRRMMDDILMDMEGEKIDVEEFQRKIKEASFIDYKGNECHYDMQYHADKNGKVTGWSIKRGNSTFSGKELGLQLTVNPNMHNKEYIKDAIYDTLRKMNYDNWDWNHFTRIMREDHGCYVNLKSDSKGNVVNYTVSRGNGRPYTASQIGANVTAKKIMEEWSKEQNKLRQKEQNPAKGTSEDENRPRRWSKEWRAEQEKKAQKPQSPVYKAEPTEEEIERKAAIKETHDTILQWKHRNYGMLYDDMMDRISNGAAARAIENGTSPFVNVNLEGAIQDITEGMGLLENQISKLMTVTSSALVGMVIPPNMPVSAGGGGNNDLSKQKDDWWNKWKNAFGMKLASSKSNIKRR